MRIAEDHVLEEMVRGLGARVLHIEAPFEPESGAYGHRHDEMGHGGKIHDLPPLMSLAFLQLASPTLPVGAYSYSQG